MLEGIGQQAKQDGQEFAAVFSKEYTEHRSITVAAASGLAKIVSLHRNLENTEEFDVTDPCTELDNEID